MKKTDDISKVVVMSFCLLKIDTSLTKKNRLKYLTNHSKKGGWGGGGGGGGGSNLWLKWFIIHHSK